MEINRPYKTILSTGNAVQEMEVEEEKIDV